MRARVSGLALGWIAGLWLALAAGVQAQVPTTVPTTPEATAPTVLECFPACRAGFLCHQSQCISACNPACGDGQVCSPEAQCVSACNPPCAQGQTCNNDGTCTAPPPPPVIVIPSAATSTSTRSWSGDVAAESEPATLGPQNRLWFDLLLYSGVLHGIGTDGAGRLRDEELAGLLSISPLARARFVTRGLMLDGVIPVASGSRTWRDDLTLPTGVERTSAAITLGNPAAAVSGVLPLGTNGAWLSAGVGIALPLALVDEEPDTQDEANEATARSLVLALSMLARGMWDVWLYAPNTFTFFAPLEIEGGSEHVRVGGELALARLIYVGNSEVRVDADSTVLQVGARVQGKVSERVSLGLRLRLATELAPRNDAADDEDFAQMSLEPFVEVTAGERLLVGAGWILNLDEPAGPTSDTMFVWGLRGSLGVRL